MEGPEHAVTSNFPISIQANMDFRHWLSPYCFDDQVVIKWLGLLVYFCTYRRQWQCFFRVIKQRNKKMVRLHFIYRYTQIRVSLPFSWKFYAIYAVRSTWTWGALFTIYWTTSRRFAFYSPYSRSGYSNFGFRLSNTFIETGRHYDWNLANQYPNIKWVHFRCASW